MKLQYLKEIEALKLERTTMERKLLKLENSHKTLLKACHKALFVLETMESRFPETVENIEKAIAQAEGK